MSETRTLGVLGGSGLYEMPGLEILGERRVETPFGAPSDAVVEGKLGETRMLFLPRHGRGHRIAPHEINYRANVFALKVLGAEQIVSLSAVGSMREELAPGMLVTIDQHIDRTRMRASTFFEGRGIVAHVSVADPIDDALRRALYAAAVKAGGKVRDKGVYVCIEGPQFSTRAESEAHRKDGADVIGMTNVTEAKLAREAELPFAALAMVTDYDCWHPSEAAVDVATVVAVMKHNAELAIETLRVISQALPDPKASPATRALAGAIMTAPSAIPADSRTALMPLIERYL